MIERWAAWLVGGVTVEGRSFKDWQRLAPDGFLYGAVGWTGEDGRRYGRQMGGNDRYWMTPDGVVGHSDDPASEIAERYPGASVKRGMWTTEAEVMRAHDESVAWLREWVGGE